MSEPAVRPSSQELADRVREGMVDCPSRKIHAPAYECPACAACDEGFVALDVLAARLQATEQALDGIKKELGTLPLDHLGPATKRAVSKAWAMAREKRPDPLDRGEALIRAVFDHADGRTRHTGAGEPCPLCDSIVHADQVLDALVDIARAARATYPNDCNDEGCLHASCHLSRALARLESP